MLQSRAGSAGPSSAPAAEEQKNRERGGVLGSSTNPVGELEPCGRADPNSEQGEVSLGWDPTSLPSSRSEGSFASLPGLCTDWAGAQPEVALRGSGSTVATANSLRVTQGPELGGQLLQDTRTHLASPRQLQLALEPGRH